MGIKKNENLMEGLSSAGSSRIRLFLRTFNSCYMWPRQESNLYLELRKLLYYPLYYGAWHYLSYQSADVAAENFNGYGQ